MVNKTASFFLQIMKIILFLSSILLSTVQGKFEDVVTCGSLLKLVNTDVNIRLHSHDLKYGTGSGQQSVTGIQIAEDINSHWYVKGPTNQDCRRGEAIKCDAIIRLQHLTTKLNLHSHYFRSPLSGNQEISCFGPDGKGDSGDHWQVKCNKNFWYRNQPVQFQHVDTKTYLGATENIFGRPINKQHEIAGLDSYSRGISWKTMEGIFIQRSEVLTSNYSRDEL